jgi:hypothetical protein
MYKAKLLSLNDLDEYEVTLEINGIDLICFVVICRYKIKENNFYPVELSLNILEGVLPKEIPEEYYKIKKVDKYGKYILSGKLNGQRLDLGKILIEDNYFEDMQEFDGKFIQLEVHAICVEFLDVRIF